MKEDTWDRAVLKLLKDFEGQAEKREINENIGKYINLTDELKSLYVRYRRPYYICYVSSALNRVKKNGEVENKKRGIWSITDKGLEKLAKIDTAEEV